MKKNITLLIGFCLLLVGCQTEQLDNEVVQENSLSSALSSRKKKKDEGAARLIKEYIVIDANRCDRTFQPTANFWWPVHPTDFNNGYFSSTEENKLTFSEYDDGTANIKGSTVRGTCIVEVDVWLKDKKDFTTWINEGGEIKDEGCSDVIEEDLSIYIIDSSRSRITASGGDCLEEGTFGVEQRPDPIDPNAPNLGVIVGPGGALWDNNGSANGLATWGWITTIPTESGDCNECDGKLTELTLEYNGDSAEAITVKTKGKDAGDIIFDQVLQPGDAFSIFGNDDKGTLGIEITLYVGGNENTKIHTSCSDPNVVPGFVSGAFKVLAGASRNGGDLCPSEVVPGERLYVFDFNFRIEAAKVECLPCKGKITELELEYNGPTIANIVVKGKGKKHHDAPIIFEGTVEPGTSFNIFGNDDKGTLGTEIKIYVNGSENAKIHTSCSDPNVGPSFVKGYFTVIRGASREGGELCPSDNPGGGDDCGECDGKVTNLILQNNGVGSDIIVKTKGKKHQEGETVFEGFVESGASFSFNGNDKKGTLGTEITIYVNGSENTKIHTSCSRPIDIGLIFGDFEVLGGASRNGGEFCSSELPN